MALTNPARSIHHGCNGSLRAFAVPFKFQRDSELVVTVTDTGGGTARQTLGVQYSITGAGTATGGTVTFLTAPLAGYAVTIEREVPLTQEVSFRTQGAFLPEVLEGAFDKGVMIAQQLGARLDAFVAGDAASEGYVQDYVAGVIAAGSAVLPEAWNFVGDASTQTFTITGCDAADAKMYVVSVAGLVKRPTIDYSVNSATETITFVSTPAAGAVIHVRQFSYAHAYSAADNSTVTATGSNTARTLAARFGEVRNVKDFGAVGNNVTDDTLAIQAAIDAAATAGGLVILPAGIYRTSDTLTLKAGVAVMGTGKSRISDAAISTKGVVISPLDDDFDVFTVAASANGAALIDVAIHYPGMTLESFIESGAGDAAGVRFSAATDMLTATHSVLLQGVEVFGFGCGFHLPLEEGADDEIGNFVNIVIRDCRAMRCSFGIAGCAMKNCLVQNFWSEGCFGVEAGQRGLPGAGSVGTQNYLSGTGLVVDGWRVVEGGGVGLYLDECEDCVIRALNVDASEGFAGILLRNCRYVRVEQSTFSGIEEHGIALEAHSGVASYEFAFTDCVVSENGKSGVYGEELDGGTLSHIDFNGCRIVTNSQAADNTHDGVDLQARNVRFVGGTVSGSRHRYGISNNQAASERWTLAGVYVLGNHAVANWHGALYVDTSNCQGINGLGNDMTAPSLPAATYPGPSHVVANSTGAPVNVIWFSDSGDPISEARIVSRGAVDRSGGIMFSANESRSARLLHGESIYFTNSLPASWVWQGQ